MEFALWITLALVVVTLLLVLWFGLRRRDEGAAMREAVGAGTERLERELRDEVGRSAQATRLDLGGALGVFQQTLLNQQGDVARTQNEQIDSFRTQLAAMQQAVAQSLQSAVAAQATQAQASRETQDNALKRFSDSLGEQLRTMSDTNERRLLEVRNTVEQRLTALQADNEKKLDQMRATVDEKLHATLEARLGESFKQVAERLEQVHKGQRGNRAGQRRACRVRRQAAGPA